MEHHSFLEKVEEGLVFRISRSFFLILALLAMLGTLAGLFLIAWGVLPVSKEVVMKEADPKPVLVTSADVKAAMNAPKSNVPQQTLTQPGEAANKNETDTTQQEFYSLADTLASLVFVDKPTLQNDFLGDDSVKRVELVRLVRQLCSALRDFPEKERQEALGKFLDLYNERETEYNQKIQENQQNYESRIDEANAKYDSTMAGKSATKYQGFVAAGSGVASVAFLAIFLVLLSMQRSLKRLAPPNKQD